MFGEGILKGLAETARNFVGSFVSAERLTTVQYPEERIAPIEATRDFPFLVYDGADWEAGLRCVAIPGVFGDLARFADADLVLASAADRDLPGLLRPTGAIKRYPRRGSVSM